MNQSKVTYQGQRVALKEKVTLEELEKLIKEPIPAVSFINTFKFGFIAKNGKITSLGLPSKELSTLPESIGNFSALQHVVLFSNQLKNLPESFCDLQSLKFLNLVNNNLRALPESFIRLRSLKILYLNHNQLKFLPKLFGELKSLKTLNLRNNKMKSLPLSFSKLSNLESLWIRNNPLDENAIEILELLKEQGVNIDLPNTTSDKVLKKILESINSNGKSKH
ncbi:MAG: leucine-rich repeat domain-containing protein [Promethearchaeota archaeon]